LRCKVQQPNTVRNIMEQINILIIGNCGVGKTYVMQNIIKSYKCNEAANVGLLHYNTNGFINVTGKYDGGIFQGSDKLSMSVMTSLDAFLEQVKGVNLFEGDRFMNKNFIAKAKPYIIKIKGSGQKGRSIRGSSQTPRQLKSIETRVNNIRYDFSFNDSYDLKNYLRDLLSVSNFNLITKVLNNDRDNYQHKQQSLF